MIKFNYCWLAVVLLCATACHVDYQDYPWDDGDDYVPLKSKGLDFSNYVAMGASFTAGTTDNALFIEAQENSFPNTLSKKFALGNGGKFVQPMMNDNIGGLLYGGNQIFNPRLYFNGSAPAVLNAVPTTEVTQKLTGANNNFGIPGAKIINQVYHGYGSVAAVAQRRANPYFARFSSSETTSAIEDVVAANPTFFTLIDGGGNDVLGYAIAGGGVLNGEQAVNQTGNQDVSTYGTWDITDPAVFASAFKTVVDALTANGAKGVIGNVPDISVTPYLTTVPYNPVPLDAPTAQAVNGAYAAYNQGLLLAQANGLIAEGEVAKRTITFQEGNNAVVIEDEFLTDLSGLGLPNYRQASADDLLTLRSGGVIGTLADQDNPNSVYGVGVPLEDSFVLTPEEQDELTVAKDAYNAAIKEIVDTNDNVILFDMESVFSEAATQGVDFDGVTLTGELVTGGLVSLDGIHLTGLGYAYLANQILKTMDLPIGHGGFGTNFSSATYGLARAEDYPSSYPESLR